MTRATSNPHANPELSQIEPSLESGQVSNRDMLQVEPCPIGGRARVESSGASSSAGTALKDSAQGLGSRTRRKDPAAKFVAVQYVARIDYSVDTDDSGANVDNEDKIANAIERFARRHGVHVDNAHAGPCWNAYAVLTCSRRRSVELVVGKVLRYVARFKGGRIL